MTDDIEQPACFYLGREYDLATQDGPPTSRVMYDARDLTTHGVVVGMTGSGKTGLCISLLEEAAIDGIPCIIIDPKGDLTNLLLQFPDLRPEDFAAGSTPRTPGRRSCRRRGLRRSSWPSAGGRGWPRRGQTPERIAPAARLVGVAHLHAGQRGGPAAVDPADLRRAAKGTCRREDLNQKIDATATALLGLTRHHRRPGAVARAHPHRPAPAARLDARAGTSTCRS